MSARASFWEEVERYALRRFEATRDELKVMHSRINEAAILFAQERMREAEYTAERR